jgi:D-Tyr-tRNAtyr deacylase
MVDDEPSDSTTIIKKILGAKLFGDETGDGWKKSVVDIDGEVLCGTSLHIHPLMVKTDDGIVSQFTLLANFKGSKPGTSSCTSVAQAADLG